MKEIQKDGLLTSLSNYYGQIVNRRLVYVILIIVILILLHTSQNHYRRKFSIQLVHMQNISRRLIILNQTKHFDVVLSYYAEDVNFLTRVIQYFRKSSTLQKLNYRIIIYNKNPNINNTYLQTISKADLVYQLPNVGQEGQTYLYHIINNYDRLADHIFFTQAGIEGVGDNGFDDWLTDRLDKQFNSSVAYMHSYSWSIRHSCICYSLIWFD